ncbi:MAG: replication-associated recombination protein A [Clostridia bacterium]|nr:replication-associated recombination protein A [Clostridia bacterium]
MENLFDIHKKNSPLSERMRARTLDEFAGQKHIVGEGSLLRRAIKANRLGSCIFYGPPGCGKTTLAYIIANAMGNNCVKLNAVSSGVSDAKKVIDEAKKNFELYGKSTFLILDECHRWSKAQSDCVLEAVEKGYITFVGSTTENPHISMTPAIVSRCRIFKFLPLELNDIKDMLVCAIKDEERGYGKIKIKIEPNALNHLAFASSGDLRNALNALELAVLTTPPNKDGDIIITEEEAEQCIQQKVLSVDENMYYDLLSCFCKSIRGSDSDAALYYSQRLINAGCDPLLIARRLIVHCSEDIGMADSNALLLATSAHYALKNIGLPEANIPLAHAIIYACEAEKSNSVNNALGMANTDAIKFADDRIPEYLKNQHYDTENPTPYKYPHDYGGYVEQVYMPKNLEDRRYYNPSGNGREKNLIRKKDKFKK